MKDDDKILRGFNSGYEIASKDMTLAKTMAGSYKGERNDFVVAFEKGIKEYELEELNIQKVINQKDDREISD